MRSGGTDQRPERRDVDRLTSATILVVDDSVAIRRILRRSLEGAGYLVEEAGDGRDGVAACRAVAPDLVLLDVDMPVMDGMAALSEMRADEALVSIPVLFLTARTGGTDVAMGLGLGAHDYLRKPCDPAELVARVASALRLSEREGALVRRAREADEASSTDSLTGLGNRRFLEGRRSSLAEEAGIGAAAGVLFSDVDHFKWINDEHGHPVGDAVLRILARRLAATLPSDATLVRWGGEEFLALVTGVTASDLPLLGEQLRSSVATMPFSISSAQQLPVTVSIGCAAGTLGDFDALVKAGDEALYAAKRAGRNQVSIAPDQ